MKFELSYIQNTKQRKAWPQRGGESTLTGMHSCHRPRIPFGHVLIERRCVNKHCKRGCSKEKEKPTHHNQQKRVPFQTRNNKNNKTCENCDPMKLELSYTCTCTCEASCIQNTQQCGICIHVHVHVRRGHSEGEREYTYCEPYLSPPPYSIWTRLN